MITITDADTYWRPFFCYFKFFPISLLSFTPEYGTSFSHLRSGYRKFKFHTKRPIPVFLDKKS
jgi:hypothetical protein